MQEAGYAPSTAKSLQREVMNHPLVRSALTEAVRLQRIGFAEMVKPFVDALTAVRVGRVLTEKGKPIFGLVPDHPRRMDAAAHLVKLHGGYPTNEETPVLPGGLNLWLVVKHVGEAGAPRVVNPPAGAQSAQELEREELAAVTLRIRPPAGH